MFLYNFKINGNKLSLAIFIMLFILIFIILTISIYNIFFKKINSTPLDTLTLTDTINTNKIFEINENNYTDILQAVSNDIDSYIGCKVHFVGYVYRLIDFDKNRFVLARDMLVDANSSQSLVVGFLCNYDKASDFTDDTWVDVTGIITKGDFYGDIAEIQVTSIFECSEPDNKYVCVPHETYIPTNSLF